MALALRHQLERDAHRFFRSSTNSAARSRDTGSTFMRLHDST